MTRDLVRTPAIDRRTRRRFQLSHYWEKGSRCFLYVWSAAGILFLLTPILLTIPLSLSNSTSLTFPPTGFSLQWYENFFTDPSWVSALRTSAILALSSSLFALVLGAFASYSLVRGAFKGRKQIRANLLAPIMLPEIIIAVSLYFVFSAIGLTGHFIGLVVAHTILILPFVVLLLTVAIQSVDVRIEHAAITLGASRFGMLRKVLMPILVPSVLVAWVFTFIVSFDNVVISLFLGGTYITLPKKMFLGLNSGFDPTIAAVATLLIALSIVTAGAIALVLRRFSSLSKMFF